MVLTGPMKQLIKSDETVNVLYRRMIEREGKSEETLRRYLEGILSFTRFMHAKKPFEALEKLKASPDVTKVLDSYIDALLSWGFSSVNVKAHWFGVKKWLIANRVNNVDWPYVARPKVSTTVNDRIPTRDELRLILSDRVSLRDKAFFLCAASSGLRIGTLARLCVGDYKPVEELGMFTVQGGKGRKLPEGRSYFTFITSEARSVLEQYLASRGRVKASSPLFARLNGEPLTLNTANISRQWRKLLERAKLNRKIHGHWYVELHAHVLRKFFQTNCKLVGCRVDFVEFWMGHRNISNATYLNESYFRPSLQEHIREYRRAAPYLTVFAAYGLTERELAELKVLLQKIKSGEIVLTKNVN